MAARRLSTLRHRPRRWIFPGNCRSGGTDPSRGHAAQTIRHGDSAVRGRSQQNLPRGFKGDDVISPKGCPDTSIHALVADLRDYPQHSEKHRCCPLSARDRSDQPSRCQSRVRGSAVDDLPGATRSSTVVENTEAPPQVRGYGLSTTLMQPSSFF